MPTVAGVAPVASPIVGGVVVTITGTGFVAGSSTVSFGSVAGTAVSCTSATSCVATSPAESPGVVNVTVTTPGGTSATTLFDQFRYDPLPTVTGVLPSAGPLGGGTDVAITGTGFVAGPTTIHFGSSIASSATCWSTTVCAAVSPAGPAGTVDVTVSTTDGTSLSSSADQFTYEPIPVVSALNPSAGPVAGGTAVTITGTGFVPGSSTVSFGLGAGTSVSCSSATVCTATTPARAAGTVDAVVTTPGGVSLPVAGDEFVYETAPSITGISPSAGPLPGGTVVTISGTGFVFGITASFGVFPGSVVSCLSATVCTDTSPAESAGTVDVTVTTPGGTSPTGASDKYSYDPVPSVTSVSPSAGPLSGSTTATITGSGFVAGATVRFGTATATVISCTLSTSCIVSNPPESAGTVNVTVSTPGGTSPTTAQDAFTYDVAPVVSSVSPAAGPLGGGTVVTITGSGFLVSATTARFGGVPAAVFSCSSTTSCTATSPAESAGAVDVTLTTAGGTSTPSSADMFSYDPVPTITAVSPAAGGTAGGDVVSITGTGFVPGATVSFGSAAGASVSCTQSTSCVATSPAEPAGTVDVTATTPGGSSATSAADNFTYDTTPTVSAIAPSAGPLAGGTVVTITGTGFADAGGVRFGSTSAASYSVNSDTSITATAPAHTAGGFDILVTNETGTSLSGAADTFTYDAVPTVTAISPAAGGIAGSDVVTITGTGFVVGSAPVRFGSTAGTSSICTSTTSCTTTSPAQSAGTVDITVGNPGGTSATSPADVFTYDGAPTVTGISSNAGPLGGGSAVTITGSGLADVSAVSFGTAPATFAVNSDTSITATVPANAAGTVDVTVTNETATSGAGSADLYTYDVVPAVSGISPRAGSVDGGDTVTITGTGFVPAATTVAFGASAGTPATCTSSTSCMVVSPAEAAATVDLTVTTPGGTSATSPADDFTFDTAPAVNSLSPNAGPLGGGTVVDISGTGIVVGATTVTFGSTAGISVSCTSTTSCTATSPPASAGVVDVTLSTVNGPSSAGAADKFSYDPVPTVTGTSPNAGPVNGGTAVTISGTGLAPGATTASFGGTASSSVVCASSTACIATSPPGVRLGTVDVVVTTPGGTSPLAGSDDQFSYQAAPIITGISPTAGPLGGGTAVTITGTGFVLGMGTEFGLSPGTSVSCKTATTCLATSPPESAGVVDVTVVAPGGISASTAADQFTYEATPVVSAVNPSGGALTGGTVVTLTGTGFVPGLTAISFGSDPATSVSCSSATSCAATSPAESAGIVDVTVATAGGGSSTSVSDAFSYDTVPSVSAVGPRTGSLLGGAAVTITGTGFVTGSTIVTFGSVAGTSVSCTTTSCVATSPPESAGVVDVTISTPGGTSATTAADTFTYDVMPIVSAIAPHAGPLVGGTVVTITGTGFIVAGSSVQFGSVPGASVSCSSTTSCVATSPPESAGVDHITVSTPGGTSAKTAADTFTYDAIPVVTAIGPAAGSSNGGDVVTMTGTGFVPGFSTVRFGSTGGTAVSCSSATTCVATSPAEPAGPVQLSVTTAGGTSATTSAGTFTYDGTPSVTAIDPSAGPLAGGTSVVITGSGLDDTSAVSFGGTAATSYTVDSDTSVTAVSPSQAAGAVDVTVTNETGTSAVVVADTFTYDATPSVSTIAPATGSSKGGDVVTVAGTGFVPGFSTVSFGSSPGTAVSCSTTTACVATSPAQSAGAVQLTVTTAGGTSETTSADTFTYDGTPSVTAIAPSAGPLSGGTSVTISGSGLDDTIGVSFGGTATTSYTVNSDTSVTAVSPAHTAGAVDVTVTNETGTSAVGAADRFSYDATPSVLSIAPAAGSTNGGDVVTVTGTGFVVGSSTVSFGAGAGTAVTCASSTSCAATSPAELAGTADVIVTTPGGSSATTAADTFTYDGTPSVTAIAPSAGPLSGGTSVTISGSGLDDASGVSFGGTAATSYTVNSDTSVTAFSPALAVGTVEVTVTNETGTSAVVAADAFTYDVTPVVTAIGPATGSSNGGDVVTITGSGFVPDSSTVSFGSSPGTAVTCSTTTSCVATSPAESAGAVPLTVTTAGGASATTSADTFTYDGTPSVTAIAPSAGPQVGGTSVTISGSGLDDVSGVSFGGTAATSYTVNSDTSVTAFSPALNVGTVDVTVTNETGTSAIVAGDTFTYDATPSVMTVAPAAGSTNGGDVVTITGTGFVVGSSTVSFGSSAGNAVTCASTTSCQATSPAEPAGVVGITLTTAGGTSSSTTAATFTYDATPVVTAIAPSAGPLSGGTSVVIIGSGFEDASSVSFGGTAATSYVVNSDTSVTAVAPAHAAGSADITVTNETGTSATASADTFTYDGTPSVTAIAPSAGPLSGGTPVVITGSGFDDVSAVSFGGTAATSYVVHSDTSVTAVAPAHAAGTLDVTVTNETGTSATASADTFTYDDTPSVTAIAPSAGPLSGGTPVVITGSGFDDVSAVSFGGTAATSYVVHSDASVTAVAPAHAAGTLDVTVTNEAGTSANVAGDIFTYEVTPSVTAIAPAAGSTNGGDVVTITGTGFVVGSSTVSFGPSAGIAVTCASSTSCATTSPPEPAGVVNITLTTAGGTSAMTAADRFTYDTTPSVTAIAPNAGPLSGGTSVVITGSGLADVSGVSFGGTAATSYTVNSDTSVTAVSPAHAAGTTDVSVTNETGTSAAVSGDKFTYDTTPSVTSLSPTTGKIAGGDTVTITGTGFADVAGVAGVTFGATNATTYTVNSDNSITATAPAHAPGTVGVLVTNETGTSAAVSGDTFTYDTTPAVARLTPSAGKIAGGDSVIITGTGFANASAVTFGGTSATSYAVNSDTSITAITPAHAAGIVDAVVTNESGTSAVVSGDKFTYDTTPTVTSVNPSAGKIVGGDTVVITGTGLANASAVSFGGTPATSYVVTSDTSITAVSPAHAAGSADVTVTNETGTSPTTAADKFTYDTTPTVTSLAPRAGRIMGGGVVTITGSGFVVGSSTVAFGPSAATLVSCSSTTTCVATSPAEPAGVAHVTVTTAGGTSSTTVADQFTYEAVPSVTQMSVSGGHLAGGTAVTITGGGFVVGSTTVKFGTSAGLSVACASTTSCKTSSPAEVAGSVSVIVTTSGGSSAATAADKFSYDSVPKLTHLSPAAGPIKGGTKVTITGSGFVVRATTVKFGTKPATVVSCKSTTTCTATSPAAKAGTVAIVVTTPGGSSAVTTADKFGYDSVPKITLLSPKAGSYKGGTVVTITGTGFVVGSTTVKFGTKAGLAVSCKSTTSCKATSPKQKTTGAVEVTVTTPGGSSTASAAIKFSFDKAAKVTGITLSPARAPGETNVTLTGSGFVVGATSVRFAGVGAVRLSCRSTTSCTATVPSLLAGELKMTVTNPGGTSIVTFLSALGRRIAVTSVVVAKPAPAKLAGSLGRI
ncbi:MAG: IPT/TIG domain-containing protein [Acidimicrobiales bacterium]